MTNFTIPHRIIGVLLKRIWILTTLFSLFFACDSNSSGINVPEGGLTLIPGLNNVVIEHDGLQRDMYILMPSDFSPDVSYPVVFFFHGLGGNKGMGRSILEFILADEDIIGISPQGYLNSWNTYAGEVPSTADDVGLTLKILKKLDEVIDIDDNRIYSMGYSNGGAFSYTLALETDKFAAIASLSASFFEGRFITQDVSKLSVLQLHGELDTVVPYNGGQSSSLNISFLSAMNTVLNWVDHDELNVVPVINNPEENLMIYTFTGNTNSHEVILYCLEETTHNIGTHPIVTSMRCYEEILEFFNRHSK